MVESSCSVIRIRPPRHKKADEEEGEVDAPLPSQEDKDDDAQEERREKREPFSRVSLVSRPSYPTLCNPHPLSPQLFPGP